MESYQYDSQTGHQDTTRYCSKLIENHRIFLIFEGNTVILNTVGCPTNH